GDEAMMLDRLARWSVGLKLEDIPPRVIEQAKNQVFSMLAAVHSGYASDLGRPIARAFPPPSPGPARIIPSGQVPPPSHGAFLMSAWSMILDYDDVMLGGHTGHSSVLVPFAYAQARKCGGAELLAAQIVANEISARINMVCALGSIRGQMATHLHLIGAAGARAKLEGLTAQTFAEAIGF